MKQPVIRKSEAIWCTNDGREIPINQLEDQHLCNCYWFSMIIWNEPHFKITEEVVKRFEDKPLPFKPLPVPNEIGWLRGKGVIKGTDIIWKDEVIGSISHLYSIKKPI